MEYLDAILSRAIFHGWAKHLCGTHARCEMSKCRNLMFLSCISLCFFLLFFGWAFCAVQLLTQELAEEGYAGVEVRVTPLRTEIIISATRPQNVLGEKGQRIRELTSVVQKRCVLVRHLLQSVSEANGISPLVR